MRFRAGASALTLTIDSEHWPRTEAGADVDSLWKLKLSLAPLRLWLDGGTLRRLFLGRDAFFRDDTPAPPTRPDDARFLLAEVGSLQLLVDWVSDMGGVHAVTEKSLAVMPTSVLVDKPGVRVSDLMEIVMELWWNELMRRCAPNHHTSLLHARTRTVFQRRHERKVLTRVLG